MIIRGIEEGDGKGGFSCGEPTLDAFLSKRAYGNDRAGIGRAYVILDSQDAGQVLGFLHAVRQQCDAGDVATDARRQAPEVSVARDLHWHVRRHQRPAGKGYRRGVDGRRHEAERCRGRRRRIDRIFLHSRDARSTAFYETMGFTSLGAEATNRPMFMPMGTVQRVIELTASRAPAARQQ